MSVESELDRLAFLNLAEFGIIGKVVSNSSGQEWELAGIFDNNFLNLDLGNSSVATSEPTFTCRTVDLNGITQDDTLIVNGSEWVISDLQHDGTGMTAVRLHKA